MSVQTKSVAGKQTAKHLWIGSLSILAVLLLGYGGVGYREEQERQLRQQIEDQLTMVSALKLEQIEAWRRERLGDGSTLAENPFFTEAVIHWRARPEAAETRRLMANLTSLQLHYGYRDVVLLDPKGRVELSLNGGNDDLLDEDDRAFLLKATKGQQPIISDLHIDARYAFPHISVLAPLFRDADPQAPSAGAILLVSDVRKSLYPLLRSWPVTDFNGEIILVRRDGGQLLFLSPLSQLQNAQQPLRMPLHDDTSLAGRAVLGETGIIYGQDYRGVDVVAMNQPLPDSAWFMTVKIDQASAFAELRQQTNLVLALTASGLGLAGIAVLLILQRRARLQAETLLRAETQRLVSEIRFSTLFAQMPEPAWIVCDNHFVEANAAALAAVGMEDRLDLLPLHPEKLSPEFQPDGESSFDKTQRQIQIAFERGVNRFDWLHRHLDGTLFPVEVTLTAIQWEGRPAIFCVWRDITEQRRMLEELQANEAKFRTLFESSKDAILLYSSQGFIDGNHSALKLFGFECRDHLLHRHPSELSPPTQLDGSDSRVEAERLIHLALDEGVCGFEWLHRKTDGTVFPSEVLLSVFEMGGEKIIQASVRDISERKRAEREIREFNAKLEERVRKRTRELAGKTAELVLAEERFRLAMEATRDGLWDWQIQTDKIFFSKGSFEMLGYQPGELPDTIDAWVGLIHPEDRETTVKAAREALNSVGHYELEYRLRNKSGSHRWIMSRGRVVEWAAPNVPLRALGMHTDITERKQAEEEVRKISNLLQSVVNSTSDAIYAKDMEGRYTLFNTAAARFFNKTVEEVIGKDDTFLFQPEEAAQIISFDRSIIATGQTSTVEETVISLAGIQAVFLSTKGPLIDKHGRIMGLFGVSRDITQRKQVETELEIAKLQAETANRAKSAFLAKMSHEIRTPMNAIIGLTHLLQREVPVPASQGKLGKIAAASQHLLQLLNDILDLAKIEEYKLVLEQTEVDLESLLRRVCLLIGERAHDKGLELIVDLDPALACGSRFLGDPTRLAQVLLNYLGNAVKFTDQGSVLLRLRVHDASSDSPLLRFEVQDTGMGIAPEQIERLFESFEQADSSINRRFGGTGLGLVINRHLAQLMGGEVGLDSSLGMGSTFWFTARLRNGYTTQTPAPTLPKLENQAALVVDDHEETRTVLAVMLEALGLRVDMAASGKQALSLLKSGACFDFVLLDWNMPGLNGLETARQIGSLSLPHAPPALLLLANAFDAPSIGEEALAQGCKAVLLKPLLPREVHESLCQIQHTGISNELAPVQQTAPAFRQLGEHCQGARLLLAEDDFVNQEVIEGMLTAVGLNCDIADNGAVAVEMARQTAYDLVLMDMQMPVMDGLEASLAIRQLPGRENLPIIAVTANAFAEDRQRCIEAGMDDFLAKPLNPDSFYGLLWKWLEKPASCGETAQTKAGMAASAAEAPAVGPKPDTEALDEPMQRLRRLPGLNVKHGLALFGGNSDKYLELLDEFLFCHAQDMEKLQGHLQASDHPAARRLAHTLKGSAANLGMEGLAAAAAALQERLDAAPFSTADLQALAQPVEAIGLKLSALAAALPSRPGLGPETDLPADLDAVLDEVERLLVKGNPDALHCFRQHLAFLSASLGAEGVKLLRSIRQMEFDQALSSLQALRQKQAATGQTPSSTPTEES